MVQTNTQKHPGSLDASVIRVKETGRALAMSSDCNPRQCYIDPFKGAAYAVMESGRNVAMSGATPLAITDCLNFGNPENPEVMWQFAQSCEGIKEACANMETPVVSGNVSLYNETNGVSIYPTPSIAMVGVNEDENRVLGSKFVKSGSRLLLLGDTSGEFGASLYMKELYNKVAGTLKDPDYTAEARLWEFVIKANKEGLLLSAKDVNVGGIAMALAKMSALSGIGANVNSSFEDKRWLFDESASRAIVEVDEVNLQSVAKLAMDLGLKVEAIGVTGGDELNIDDITISIEKLKDIYFNTFAKRVKADILD